MANVKSLVDYNRKNVTTYGGQVKPVIPEHFTEQYPDLVKFLEAYYEYLDSDGQFGNSNCDTKRANRKIRPPQTKHECAEQQR